jgi:hypothetical protein
MLSLVEFSAIESIIRIYHRKIHPSSSKRTGLLSTTTATTTTTKATTIASDVEAAAATDGHQLERLPTSTDDTMTSFFGVRPLAIKLLQRIPHPESSPPLKILVFGSSIV